jgi:hypothetical protein
MIFNVVTSCVRVESFFVGFGVVKKEEVKDRIEKGMRKI